MTRHMMLARSQGKTVMQRMTVRLERDDVHRWVLIHNLTPEVEFAVRTWSLQRLNDFYCDLQLMYTPLSTSSVSRNDEAVEVDARGLNARDAVKALIKAMGLNPRISVYGWRRRHGKRDDMTIVAFFDIAFLATLPGRSPFAHSICVQPHEDKRKPFTVGIVRVRTTPQKATLELCDRLSNPLIEVDAVVHKNIPLDCVCDWHSLHGICEVNGRR